MGKNKLGGYGKMCAPRPPCAQAGQTCQNNGDCCDSDECQILLGGNGKVCGPPPPFCSQGGQPCQNNGDCCDGNCKNKLGGYGKMCAPRPPCAPAGQSCQNNGDCCDNDECRNLYGGSGKICAPPSTSNCVAAGAFCSPTCPGCQIQQCCGGGTCHKLHGDGYACAA